MTPIQFCRLCSSPIIEGLCSTCRSTVGQGKIKAAMFDLFIHMGEIDRADLGSLRVLVRQVEERVSNQRASGGESDG